MGLSNTQKWIVWGDMCGDKARGFFGNGHPRREQQVREPRRTALPHGICLKFYGNGVTFRIISDQSSCLTHTWSGSGSFLLVWASLSQDGFQHRGCWKVGGLLPPTGPSQILPVSLQGSTISGPPSVRQLMQAAVILSGQGEQLLLIVS